MDVLPDALLGRRACEQTVAFLIDFHELKAGEVVSTLTMEWQRTRWAWTALRCDLSVEVWLNTYHFELFYSGVCIIVLPLPFAARKRRV